MSANLGSWLTICVVYYVVLYKSIKIHKNIVSTRTCTYPRSTCSNRRTGSKIWGNILLVVILVKCCNGARKGLCAIWHTFHGLNPMFENQGDIYWQLFLCSRSSFFCLVEYDSWIVFHMRYYWQVWSCVLALLIAVTLFWKIYSYKEHFDEYAPLLSKSSH